MIVIRSPYADPGCKFCDGRGVVVERGRLYGDPANFTECQCYDRKAAQRDIDDYKARFRAELDEADDLMAEASAQREKECSDE